MLGRSLLIVATPVILLQVVTTFLFFDRHWAATARALCLSLAGDISYIIKQVEDDPSSAKLDQVIRNVSLTMDLMVSFHRGESIEGQESTIWNRLLQDILINSLQKKLHRPFVLSIYEMNEWLEIRVPVKSGVLSVLVPQRRLFSYTSYLFLLWTIFASLVLTITALIFMRNQIRPIKKLAVAAERFGKGIDMVAFKPEGASEVRQASAAFIAMRQNIKEQMVERTHMLAGVSHDLRTPLARMKLILAMMPQSMETDSLEQEVSDMADMISIYLAFARDGEGEAKIRTDIMALILDVVGRYQHYNKEISVNIGAEPLFLLLRPRAMTRCLDNLLSNALRFGTTISVKTELYNDRLKIYIEDDGPGIPHAKKEDLMQPYQQLEHHKHKERNKGHMGLGLAIARDIARGHNGDLQLHDSNLGGLAAVILLPIDIEA